MAEGPAGTVFSLGSNQGDRGFYIAEMQRQITDLLAPPVSTSQLMETEPMGVPGPQPWYYNRIVAGAFEGSVWELIEHCQRIENELGRVRKSSKAPRTADIDILLFGDLVINNEKLVLPHAELLNRRFCVEGVAAVAPDMRHPTLGKSFAALCREIPVWVQKQGVRIIGG